MHIPLGDKDKIKNKEDMKLTFRVNRSQVGGARGLQRSLGRPMPGSLSSSQPLPRARAAVSGAKGGGPGGRRLSSPPSVDWILRPVRPYVAKGSKAPPSWGSSPSPGAGRPGVDRKGWAEVAPVPWGQSRRSCRLLSRLNSQEDNLPPASQRREKPGPVQLPRHPFHKAGVPGRPCLPWPCPPRGPCAPLGEESPSPVLRTPFPCLLRGLGARPQGPH